MSGEKPGKTTVKFNREEGENIVGEVEGDRRPVYVNKKSIRPRLGDIWACHLNVINESGQECYLAILEDKLGMKAVREYLPMQPGDVYQTYADVDDLMRDFDFRPATPLAVGLERFAEWYRDYYSL